MVRMSRTRGTRLRMTLSSVRSAAASAGRAEFFEPLVGMEPWSGCAAFDDKFIHSIYCLLSAALLRLERYCLRL